MLTAEADLDDILNTTAESFMFVDTDAPEEMNTTTRLGIVHAAVSKLDVICHLDCSVFWPQKNQMALKMEDFRFLSVLGRGHFGKVLLPAPAPSG